MSRCAIVAGALGCLGSAAYVLLYVTAPEIRNVARRLLLSLALVEGLQGALYALQGFVPTEDPFWCWLIGPLLTATTLSSALWTACIAFYVALVVKNQTTSGIFTRFRILCWGYPFVWVAAVLWHQLSRYGRVHYNSVATGECFEGLSFDPCDKPFLWIGSTVPLVACMWVTSACYLEARLQVQVLEKVSARDAEQAQQYAEAAVKYALLPTLFVISRSWIYVEGIVAIYDPTWLPVCSCLRVIGIASQGFTDFVVAVLLTRKVRRHIFTSKPDDNDTFALLLDRSLSQTEDRKSVV